jgi:hypothetical protein
MDHLLKEEWVEGQIDPFHAECRAFGRIQDKGRNGDIAVRCYGFTFVSADHEEFLAREFGVSDWNRQSEHQGKPFRAIVKDLVPDTVSFTAKMRQKMKSDLKALNGMNIYVMDIRRENYKGGYLLDFSAAWTKPHVMMWDRVRPKIDIDNNLEEDEIYFDAMLEDAIEEGMKVRTIVRIRPNGIYTAKLRKLPHRKGKVIEILEDLSEDTLSNEEEDEEEDTEIQHAFLGDNSPSESQESRRTFPRQTKKVIISAKIKQPGRAEPRLKETGISKRLPRTVKPPRTISTRTSQRRLQKAEASKRASKTSRGLGRR